MLSTPPVIVEVVHSQAIMCPRSTTKPRSGSCGSTDSDIPEMIMSSSLTSFSESDSDSLASSIRSMNQAQSSPTCVAASPRSIFGSYWSSPTRKDSEKNDEEDVLERLRTLRLPMPLVDNEDEGSTTHTEPKVVHERRPRTTSLDDSSIDYQAPTHSPITKRRQILPPPPPQTAISSSLLMAPRRPLLSEGYGERRWKSTTALLKQQSCLRKSRYSCSAIVNAETAVTGQTRLHRGLRNEGRANLCGNQEASPSRDELKKSVSFYSKVSVFEFAVPPEQRRSQTGWSDYFA